MCAQGGNSVMLGRPRAMMPGFVQIHEPGLVHIKQLPGPMKPAVFGPQQPLVQAMQGAMQGIQGIGPGPYIMANSAAARQLGLSCSAGQSVTPITAAGTAPAPTMSAAAGACEASAGVPVVAGAGGQEVTDEQVVSEHPIASAAPQIQSGGNPASLPHARAHTQGVQGVQQIGQAIWGVCGAVDALGGTVGVSSHTPAMVCMPASHPQGLQGVTEHRMNAGPQAVGQGVSLFSQGVQILQRCKHVDRKRNRLPCPCRLRMRNHKRGYLAVVCETGHQWVWCSYCCDCQRGGHVGCTNHNHWMERDSFDTGRRNHMQRHLDNYDANDDQVKP